MPYLINCVELSFPFLRILRKVMEEIQIRISYISLLLQEDLYMKLKLRLKYVST